MIDDILANISAADLAASKVKAYGTAFPVDATKELLDCEKYLAAALELVRELGFQREAA